MPDVEATVRASERADSDLGRALLPPTNPNRIDAIAMLLCGLMGAAGCVFLLAHPQQPSWANWFFYEALGLFGLPFLLMVYVVWQSYTPNYYHHHIPNARMTYLALRESASSQDDALLPPARLPALPPDALRPSAEQTSLGVLRLDDFARRQYQRRWRPLYTLPIYGAIIATITADVVYRPTLLAYGNAGLPFALWGAMMLALIATVIGNNTSRTIRLFADAQGLRARYDSLFARRTELIEWNQVRSFTQVEFYSFAYSQSSPFFVLDCGRAMFAWGYFPSKSSSGSRTEARRFVQTVVTRSGVPLRDATSLVAELAQSIGGQDSAYWVGKLAIRRDKLIASANRWVTSLASALMSSSAMSAADIQAVKRQRRRFTWLAAIPAVVYFAIVIVFMATRP